MQRFALYSILLMLIYFFVDLFRFRDLAFASIYTPYKMKK